MKGTLLNIFVLVSVATLTNATLNLKLMIGGRDVSLGPYYSNVSVGNISQRYPYLNTADINASENAVELVDLLRRMFGVGLFSIPPLDPFTTSKLKPLTIGPDTFISGKVFLDTLTLTGAKEFKVKAIELRMKTGRVDFEVDIPKVNFSVNFKTDLYLGGLIPLSLKGRLRGNIDELQLSGALQTEARILQGLPKVVIQLSGATLNIRAQDVQVRLLDGIRLDNDTLQSIYDGEDDSGLSQWVSSTRDKISKYALNTFLSLANDVLRGVSREQIIAFLLPKDQIDSSGDRRKRKIY